MKYLSSVNPPDSDRVVLARIVSDSQCKNVNYSILQGPHNGSCGCIFMASYNRSIDEFEIFSLDADENANEFGASFMLIKYVYADFEPGIKVDKWIELPTELM